MKLISLLLLLLSSALTSAQEPPAVNPPRFDLGTIDAGFYINNCLGFSYPILEGWEINSDILGTSPGTAKHQVGGGLILLIVDQHTNRPFLNRMILTATNASTITYDTAEFVSRIVHPQGSGDQPGRKILKEPYAVDLSGKHFFRSDFTEQHPDVTLYKTFLSTKFRGYFLGWTVVAGTPDELEGAVNSFQKIVFRQDQLDPNCVMGPDDTKSGLISGIVASNSSLPTIALPQRVRVSQGVSQGLLIKKVQPEYPEAARNNFIQGTVVLTAEIDTDGNVKDLHLVSGHPMLVPAAIDAVKQWKYRPYFLQGRPVNVETQITVIFSLQRR